MKKGKLLYHVSSKNLFLVCSLTKLIKFWLKHTFKNKVCFCEVVYVCGHTNFSGAGVDWVSNAAVSLISVRSIYFF